MRISQLARATGVSVATIKFYLREGLLPRARAPRDPGPVRRDHVARLRLIRALVGPGGLAVAQHGAVVGRSTTRRVDPDLLGVAASAVGGTAPHDVVFPARRADADWGWEVDTGSARRSARSRRR